MKSMRLFEILLFLLKHKHTTATYLANKYDVSVRTIYRDVDSLSSMGMPVYSVQGKNGGIYLSTDFVLDSSVVSREERHHIITALQMLNSLPFVNYDTLLNKLNYLFKQERLNGWIDVDFSRWFPTNEPHFDILKQAILDQVKIKVDYVSATSGRSTKLLAPFKLTFKSSSWYLTAYDFDKQSVRLFKLTRIWAIKRTKTLHLLDPTKFPLPSLTYKATPALIDVHLKFTIQVAHQVLDIFDHQFLYWADDALYLKGHLEDNEWLHQTLASFGTHVTVISPTQLTSSLT